VSWQPTESFQLDFKDGLLDKIKNAFPLVRQLNYVIVDYLSGDLNPISWSVFLISGQVSKGLFRFFGDNPEIKSVMI
jgi:hypothetical protein